MKNRFLLLFTSILFTVFFSACGGGGGGEKEPSTSSEVINKDKKEPSNITNDDKDTNFIIYKSVSLKTDSFIESKCKDLGGIAIYSGVDKNKNAILDEDERVGEPQVVCNGASQSNFTTKELSIGDEHCPKGGIELITKTNSAYICNKEIKNDNVEFSKTSTIKGHIKTSTINKSIARMKRANALKSQEGTLWLTADKLKSAIAEDKKKVASSSKVAIPNSITKPIKVDIDKDNNYKIPNVPSGEYSLVYIDEKNKKGVKLDNISVSSNTTLTKDIDSTNLKTTGSVTLTVKSLLLGTQLTDADVRLNELDKTLKTDTNAKVSFKNLPKGNYSLTISKDGYVAKYLTFNISSDKETDLKTVELNSQKGSLVGSVEADAVDDFANIIVYAKSADGSLYTTFTDSNGNYTFKALPVGDGYSVVAYAHDFESTKVDNISIENTQTSSANHIYLTSYKDSILSGGITGFVRFADVQDSLSHAGIIVSVEGTDFEAITSRDGSFILNNLTAGKYTLNFTDSNHKTQTKKINLVDASMLYVDDISLLPKTGSIVGRVVDELGTNVAQAYITIITSSQTITALTDLNGTYNINGVLAGTHEVIVAKGGYGAGATLVNVVENKTTNIKNSPIVLSRKLLTGKINLKTADNSGATISLLGTDISDVTTDKNGDFTLYGVGAGNYQLQITKAGYITKALPITITSSDGYSLPYVVELEQSLGTISGVVTTAKVDNSGITISIENTTYTTVTNTLGAWSMKLPIGEYKNNILFTHSDFTTQTIKKDFSVKVSKNTSIQKVTLISKKGKVKVKVTDGVNPIVNASVRTIDGTTFTTDSKGIITLTSIPVGSQTIIASKDGYGIGTLSVNVKASSVLDKSDSPIVLTQLVLTGKINLKTADNSGATISLLGTDISDVTTDKNGDFTLYGVGAGNYQLQITKAGYITKTLPITITSSDGYSLPYVVELEQSLGTISGVVTTTKVDNSGITISIENTTYTTVTNTLGAWSMKLPIGEYKNNILFTHSDFTTQTIKKDFSVKVSKNTSIQKVTLISKKGKVKVKVTDGVNPIVNANVRIIDGTTFTTDSKGIITLTSIPVGSQTIIASKDGYGIGTLSVNVKASSVLDKSDSPIVLTQLVLTGKINLKTADNSGATVSLLGTDISDVTTDKNGDFTLYGVGAGNYQLQITKAGYITKTLPITITSSDGYSLPYVVELELAKGTLQGVASLTNKASNDGIKVEILGTSYITYTDATGKWSINIPTGNYAKGIKFSKELFETAVVSETATVVENSSYSVVSVSMPQVSQNISGKVTVSGFSDFSKVVMSVTGISGDAKGSTATLSPNENGNFTLSQLQFGEYTYTLTYPDKLHEEIISSFVLDGSTLVLDLGDTNLRTSYVTINSDKTYTNSKDVTLQIGNSDATYMQITEGDTTYAKEDFASTKNITLSDGDGAKTVTVDFFDANSNALAGVSDAIILDTSINLTSLTHSGASTKGDTLHLKLTTDEVGGKATVSIEGLTQGTVLYDNGLLGDTTKNDGIYETNFPISTSKDLDAVAIATFTDKAGNVDTINSTTNVVLSTPAVIQDVKIVSNVNEGSMGISFSTDELTTSKILYGESSDSLDNEADINTAFSNSHSVTLSNLTPNAITYFKLVVTDKGSNETEYNSQSKLAPPPPSNLSITAGNNEVGMAWQMGEGNYTVAYYDIYRSKNDEAFIKINNSNIQNMFFVDTTAQNDTKYSYKVVAIDESANASEKSEPISTTPKAEFKGSTEVTDAVISNSQIWIKSKSPYIIKNAILVESGNTLTLSPGIELRFESGTYLKVEGTLVAKGTKEKKITFTSNSDNPAKGDWEGVWFNGADTNSIIQNSKILYSNYALKFFENNILIIRDNLFKENNTCIFTYTTNTPIMTIDYNIFENNDKTILLNRSSNFKIKYNSFNNNTQSVRIEPGCSNIDINDNNISSNSDGIYFADRYQAYDENYNSSSNINIINNNIINNNTGIHMRKMSGSINNIHIKDNNISNNNYGIYLDNIDGCGEWYWGSHFNNIFIKNNIINNNSIIALYLDSTGTYIEKNEIKNNNNSMELSLCSEISLLYNNFNNDYNNFNFNWLMKEIKFNNFNKLDISITEQVNQKLNYNYWGETTTSEMNKKGDSANIEAITDFYDDFELGKVDYSDWLTSASTQVGVRTKTQQILDDTNLSIQDGASDTTTLDVDIVLSTSSATQMWISNSPNFTDGAWESFADVKSWTLKNKGEGKETTVFAKFKDEAGNESVIKYDNIIYQP